MKKSIVCFFVGLAAAAAAFCGCGISEHVPDAEYYFKTGDVYRVLELESQTPEHKKDFGLESYIMPSNGNVVGTSVTLIVGSTFLEGSILYDGHAPNLNKEGIEVIYDCLNIEPVEISDECFICSYTGLFSFTPKMKYGTEIQLNIDLTSYNKYDLLGCIADVDVYTFNYTDYSAKDGSEIKKGSFAVYVVVDNVYVGRFSLANN